MLRLYFQIYSASNSFIITALIRSVQAFDVKHWSLIAYVECKMEQKQQAEGVYDIFRN